MFGFLALVFKKNLRMNLENKEYNMSLSESGLRNKWKEGIFTEWEFYKRLWKLKGRLAMLSEIIKILEEK